jgi:hypothetical protein
VVGLICWLLVGAVVEVAVEQHCFRCYTSADGLSQAVSQAIYQDHTAHTFSTPTLEVA